jgi:hypothetical protein
MPRARRRDVDVLVARADRADDIQIGHMVEIGGREPQRAVGQHAAELRAARRDDFGVIVDGHMQRETGRFELDGELRRQRQHDEQRNGHMTSASIGEARIMPRSRRDASKP